MRQRRQGGVTKWLTASLGSLVLVLSSLVSTATPSHAEPAIVAILAPESDGVATPESPALFRLTLTNTGAVDVPSFEVSVRLSAAPLLTVSDAQGWFGGESSVEFGSVIADVAIDRLSRGATVSVPVSVNVADELSSASWSVFGLDAQADGGSSAAFVSRSAVVWQPSAAPTRTGFTTIVPIVAPANGRAFFTRDELTAMTSPDGSLTRALDAGAAASMIAVDPRIVSSIVRLGEDAPAVAVEWLGTLRGLARPSFALQYGDADIGLAGQAGFSQLISPDNADLANATREALSQAWSPSFANVVWAEPGTLTDASLSTISSGRETPARRLTLIAGSGNASSEEGSHVVLSPAAIEGESNSDRGLNTVVANDAFTSALRRAEASQSEAAWRAASFEAATFLAVLASKGGGLLVGGFSREYAHEAKRGQTLATIEFLRSLPWAKDEPLESALDHPSITTRLSPSPEGASRIAGGAQVFDTYAMLAEFSSSSSAPAEVRSYAARVSLPLLSVAFTHDDAWPSALDDLTKTASDYLTQVHFGMTSVINMVGGQASIPLAVVNEHDFDVTVVVRAYPSNPRLSVGADQSITVPAGSQATVKIPVVARVGNGDVDLLLTMSTTTGRTIGESVSVPVRVRADWEGFGLAILGFLFVGLVVTGIIRTIRRRQDREDS